MRYYKGTQTYPEYNVEFWIHYDELLYNRALVLAGMYKPEVAAHRMQATLPERTPDGVLWSHTSLTKAIRKIQNSTKN